MYRPPSILHAAVLGVVGSLAFDAVRAQEGVRFGMGYNGGFYFQQLKNLQVEAFVMNEIEHPYWDRPLDISPYFHGLTFDLHLEDEKWGLFWYWKNHHMIYEAGGVDPVSGFDEELKLKVRLNTFGVLGFEAIAERFRIGVSLDVGAAKIFRQYAYSGNEDPAYELFYEKSGGLLSPYSVYGHSVFLQYNLLKPLRLQVHWFHDWFGIDPMDSDDGTSYYYRFSNLSVGLLFDLGNNK